LQDKVKLSALIFIVGLLSITLIYYLFLYSTIDKTPTGTSSKKTDLYEIIIDSNGNERKIKHQYPVDMEFPEFIVRRGMEIPSEFGFDYDFFKGVGIRLVSTGEFSTATIKDPSGTKKLAEVLQLKVYIDDKQGFLEKNEPFDMAIEVYPAPNIRKDESYLESERERLIKELKDRDGNPREPTKEEIKILNEKLKIYSVPNLKENIAPGHLHDNAVRLEKKRLIRELTQNSSFKRTTREGITALNEKIRVYSESLTPAHIPQEVLEEMFKEGTPWIMTPYLNSEDSFIEYSMNSEYSVLLDEYYGGVSSTILSKILSKNVVNVKNPVMMVDLFVIIN